LFVVSGQWSVVSCKHKQRTTDDGQLTTNQCTKKESFHRGREAFFFVLYALVLEPGLKRQE